MGVAMQAATYCETWTYACNIPIPPNDPQRAYPTGRTRLGISLIATVGRGKFHDQHRLRLLPPLNGHQLHALFQHVCELLVSDACMLGRCVWPWSSFSVELRGTTAMSWASLTPTPSRPAPPRA